jgi:hypothetical protein
MSEKIDMFNVHFDIEDVDVTDLDALKRRAVDNKSRWYVELRKAGGRPSGTGPKAGIITVKPDEKIDGVSFKPVHLMAVSGPAWFPEETTP